MQEVMKEENWNRERLEALFVELGEYLSIVDWKELEEIYDAYATLKHSIREKIINS